MLDTLQFFSIALEAIIALIFLMIALRGRAFMFGLGLTFSGWGSPFPYMSSMTWHGSSSGVYRNRSLSSDFLWPPFLRCTLR